MDELNLVKNAKNGDLDAFNRLVLTYQELSYNIAFRYLSDPAAAEDATQTAFINAFRSLHSFRGGSFKAWLLRIVTNACYDELRRQKRRPTTSLEPCDDDQEEIETPQWIADDAPTPEEVVETSELDQAVQICLERLPDDFRMVAVMVDVHGFDYQEVSHATGAPIGTVKSRLARARMRLRDCLRDFRELLPYKYRLENKG